MSGMLNITNHCQCHEATVLRTTCADLPDLTVRDMVIIAYLTGSSGLSLKEALQRAELYYAVPCEGVTICDCVLEKWHSEAKDANKLIYRRLDDLIYEIRTSFFGKEWIIFSATPIRGIGGEKSWKNPKGIQHWCEISGTAGEIRGAGLNRV